MSLPVYAKCAVAVLAVLAVSGCAESRLRLNPDFGSAYRQDVAAQIADPDAHYAGVPAPGSNGSRTELAQKRYEKGQVIQPSTTGASDIGNRSGSSGGSALGASPSN